MTSEKLFKYTNLCDSCKHEFATCDGKPTFAIDLDPDSSKPDTIAHCLEYEERER
jgi:hypothetical protein